MQEIQTRAVARNSYTLDLPGVVAHVRDTTATRMTLLLRSVTSGTVEHRPRSRVGPSIRGAEHHAIADAYRIR